MKKLGLIIWALAVLVACTEKTDLRSEGEYNEYLAVDATLTDRPEDPQRVFLSRTVPYFGEAGDHAAAAVEKARVQAEFIKRVQQQLKDENLTLVRGDVFKFLSTCRQSFDIIFADPPYDLPRFGEIPKLVLESSLVHDGTLFIMEHPREHDFSALPHFSQQRVYGKVNFSLFEINQSIQDT